MLTFVLSESEDSEPIEICLEHSLVSLSKWESKHEKAFFGREERTEEELADYVVQMIVGEKPKFDILKTLTLNQVDEVFRYVNSKQTATWFNESQKTRSSQEIITNELIYFWMIDLSIPFEPCQNWHLNRLMTLIKICGVKRTKPKKMSPQAMAEQYHRLNEERRNKLGTAG